MPMTWTDQARAELVAHILRLHPIKLNYDALAEAMGPECTKKAVQHQIQRMKNAITSVPAVDDEPEADARAQGPATRKKRAHATPAISAMKGARRKVKVGVMAAGEEDEEMDEEEEGVPVGKKKKVRFEDEGVLLDQEEEELIVEKGGEE